MLFLFPSRTPGPAPPLRTCLLPQHFFQVLDLLLEVAWHRAERSPFLEGVALVLGGVHEELLGLLRHVHDVAPEQLPGESLLLLSRHRSACCGAFVVAARSRRRPPAQRRRRQGRARSRRRPLAQSRSRQSRARRRGCQWAPGGPPGATRSAPGGAPGSPGRTRLRRSMRRQGLW